MEQQLTFEQKMERLNEISTSLSNDNLGLEKSVALFEEAQILLKDLYQELDSLEKRVTVVEDGKESEFQQDIIEK